MAHYLYILYSITVDKFYIGESPDVAVRQNLHNQHHFKNSFTKIATDGEVKLILECECKSDAIYLEKFIKRMKSKSFTLKIIKNPTILRDILSKR